MAGCAAFVLPSKPRPEFVETFGIALVEKMLAGGGPVITTDTGGIGEAVGDTALIVPVDSPSSITAALDLAVTMPLPERADMAARARPTPCSSTGRTCSTSCWSGWTSTWPRFHGRPSDWPSVMRRHRSLLREELSRRSGTLQPLPQVCPVTIV